MNRRIAVATVILCLTLALSATALAAPRVPSDRVFNFITLNAGSQWTPTAADPELAENGSSVTLQPPGVITVTVNLDLVGEADWDSTQWEIVGTALTGCVPLATPSQGPATALAESFNIDTTGLPFGQYDLRITAINENTAAPCVGHSNVITLPLAINACADSDGDGVCDADDNCPNDPNPLQENGDGDADGDACDACPIDANDDSDGDGVCDSDDVCPNDLNDDSDGDGICDSDDACPDDATNDTDGDGLCNKDDPCPNDFNNDSDGDGVCDSQDNCPADNPDDSDGDGVCDSDDACPNDNPDDADNDGLCDSDDNFPTDPDNDADKDGISGDIDNCPVVFNPQQKDTDGDGIGDACTEPAQGQAAPAGGICNAETQFTQTLFWRYPLCACSSGTLMFIPATLLGIMGLGLVRPRRTRRRR